MANLLQSAVKILDSFTTDGNNGKKYSARVLQLTLTGQGGLTNKIPASVLALRDVVRTSSATASDNTVYSTAPSYDGSFVIFSGGDITKTVQMTVFGHP